MSVRKYIHLSCMIFGLGNSNPVKNMTKETQAKVYLERAETLLLMFPWSCFLQGYCSLDQISYRRDVFIFCQTSRVASLIIRIMFPQRYFLPRSFPAPAVMLEPAIYPKVCFFFWFELFLLAVSKVSSSYPSFINNPPLLI